MQNFRKNSGKNKPKLSEYRAKIPKVFYIFLFSRLIKSFLQFYFTCEISTTNARSK